MGLHPTISTEVFSCNLDRFCASGNNIEDDNFTAPDEEALCLSSAKILHRADHLRKGIPKESICRLRVPKSIVHEIEGDIRIDGNSSNVFHVNSKRNETLKVRPFPRNCDRFAMGSVREFSLKSVQHQNNESVPQCSSNHNYHAIIFSTAGYTMSNFFHGFTDLLIPLFLTAHRYDGDVQFLISSMSPWWVNIYKEYFTSLSRYEIIDVDNQDRNDIHCYKSVTIGLYAHREFAIDPFMPPLGYTFANFTEFMRKSYSVKRHDLHDRAEEPPKKPRLLIFSRKRSRKLLNINETVSMATDMGFEVLVMEGGEVGLNNFAQIINSCDAILGIHGAALSYMVFLPKHAVVIQIIPWGKLEGLCWCDYAFSVPKAELKYLEYQVSLDESSLLNKYGIDHPYIKDPFAVHAKGWFVLKDVYMVDQDVMLDLKRFSGVLIEALKHVKKYK
ncbi:hypothetical protein LUZ60_001096 [Juncus effusus]|nr:hypothetical protein LUZ60_001096 [Juncus effusus]